MKGDDMTDDKTDKVDEKAPEHVTPEKEIEAFEVSDSDLPPAPKEQEDVKQEDKSEKEDTDLPKEDEDKTADEATSDNEDKEGELPKGIKRRLGRADRQKNEAIERAEKAERELEEFQDSSAKRDKTKAEFDASKVKAPDPEDFEDYDAFEAARDEYEAKAKDVEPTPEPEKQDDKEPDSKPDAELVSAVDTIKEEISADLWAKVAAEDNADFELSREMVLTIAESDDPEKILAHLIEKPERASKIARMTMRKQIVELARIGDMQPPKPKITEADKPIDPVKGSDASVNKLGDGDFGDFETARDKQEANRGHGW